MKKNTLLLIFLLLTAIAAGAKTNTYKIKIGQFDRIRITDNVNVVYKCIPDSTGMIKYSGNQEFADAFIFSNNNGCLHIQVNTEDVDKPDLPVLYIYSDFLTNVENSSDFNTTIISPAPVPQFKATQVGNGSIDIEDLAATKVNLTVNTGRGSITCSGSSEKAILKLVGTGIIQADRLKSDYVKCSIAGSGSIGCWPLQKLETKGIGSTKIYYKGSPAISKKGGGKLIQLSGDSDIR